MTDVNVEAMNNTQEDFNSRIYDVIKDKIFLSHISGLPIDEVVKKLPDEIEEGKVLFDGLMLYDGIEGIEDDIQQMTAFTKDLEMVNLEDYYTENEAFDDDGWERFIAALERLMTKEEYDSWIFRAIEFGDNLFTKGGDKIIFLAEKDGLYYCGLRGCSESIPYDYTGKCLLADGKGLDVSDGKLDVDIRADYPMDITDAYTVGELSNILKKCIAEKLIESKTKIIVDQEYGIAETSCWEGYFHIVTQPLYPNPYLEQLVANDK